MVSGMAYPSQFHRLVMIGTAFGDVWNTTLSLIPVTTVPAVSDDLIDHVASVVGDWFDNPLTGSGAGLNGININGRCFLTSIKLNRIGTDGRYVDATPKEHVYTTPVQGGSLPTNHPPQLTIAATLRGTNERARAGKGRMYFPPSVLVHENLGSDGRLTAANALNYAKGTMFLLGAIADAYLAESVGAVPGIASRAGTGAFQGVAKVTVGRVVDTMRSRRSALNEDPQEWGTP